MIILLRVRDIKDGEIKERSLLIEHDVEIYSVTFMENVA